MSYKPVNDRTLASINRTNHAQDASYEELERLYDDLTDKLRVKPGNQSILRERSRVEGLMRAAQLREEGNKYAEQKRELERKDLRTWMERTGKN